MKTSANPLPLCLILAALVAAPAASRAAHPKINPGPGGEPNWPDVLKQQWGLNADRDLRNPYTPGSAPAFQFVRANQSKPVTFTPIIALGMETPTHGGWYRPGDVRAGDAAAVEAAVEAAKKEAWAYAHKQSAEEIQAGRYAPPKLAAGSAEFDPGDAPFALWVSNENFKEPGVFTDPRVVASANPRLRSQPYKATIYPNVDKQTGQPIGSSYIIGWEYSDNDDFQDVVTRLDNARLLPPGSLKGIVEGEPMARKLAGGFKFTEGPAWDFRNNVLYFSDIPAAQIVRYADGKTSVATDTSGQSNGLMFDKAGRLIACEHANRRVSRRSTPSDPGQTLAGEFEGKKLNSPNDLWIDTEGGIYFTDPRYGPRDDLELDKEAVYYLTADGKLTRIINSLVRPNGIALSPDGRVLYVVDNGASTLHRYAVTGPGRVGRGERIAFVPGPDGMSVDEKGRPYVTMMEGTAVLEPDGTWIGVIGSAEQPANCTFGGPGYRTLFITARTSLYAIETQTRGWHVHLDGAPQK